nr:MAG TPA: hypothetical protein [Caudoviricetes sp.]
MPKKERASDLYIFEPLMLAMANKIEGNKNLVKKN